MLLMEREGDDLLFNLDRYAAMKDYIILLVSALMGLDFVLSGALWPQYYCATLIIFLTLIALQIYLVYVLHKKAGWPDD